MCVSVTVCVCNCVCNCVCVWQVIHWVTKLLYFLSSRKHFLAASLVVFSTQHVTFRLVWALTHYPEVREGVCVV